MSNSQLLYWFSANYYEKTEKSGLILKIAVAFPRISHPSQEKYENQLTQNFIENDWIGFSKAPKYTKNDELIDMKIGDFCENGNQSQSTM